MGSSKSDVGANIKRLREAAGISQSELARRIGRVPSLISQYETGKAAPSWDTLDDIARALGAKRTDLMSEHDAWLDALMKDADLFGYQVTVYSHDEEDLLELYRSLDPEKQAQLVRIARSL